jgi:hypothetical protein
LGASQIFDKHPGLEKLGDAIRKHVDLRRAHEGRFSNSLRGWYNKHKNNALALKTASEYWQAEDSGKGTAAAAIRANASPAAQQLIDTETKTLNEMFDLAEQKGYRVKDPRTGRYHPFKKGAHVFPRMIKQNVIDIFRNSNGVGKEYRALRDQLINSGAISATNADAEMLALKDKVLDLVQGDDVMANVDLVRNTQLPSELYDYSFPAIRRFEKEPSSRRVNKSRSLVVLVTALDLRDGGSQEAIGHHGHECHGAGEECWPAAEDRWETNLSLSTGAD